MAGPISHAEHRSSGRKWNPVPASLRQFGGLFGHAHRTDHGPLSVPAADRTGRAAGRTRCRLSAGPTHVTVAVEEGRLQHDAAWQMASRLAPEIWTTAKRLRSLLRIPRRSRRLLRASRTTRRRFVGRRCQIHQMGYLTDMLGSRAVDVVNGLRENWPSVSDQPAFQRAALAVGSAGRRGRVEPASARRSIIDFDGGTQKTYRRMIQEMDLQMAAF